jgi:hypothetical protein
MTQSDSNGWVKYEKLFLEDRKSNQQEHRDINTKLDTIISRLDKNEGASQVKTLALNLGIPTLVAFMVTALTLWLAP